MDPEHDENSKKHALCHVERAGLKPATTSLLLRHYIHPIDQLPGAAHRHERLLRELLEIITVDAAGDDQRVVGFFDAEVAQRGMQTALEGMSRLVHELGRSHGL